MSRSRLINVLCLIVIYLSGCADRPVELPSQRGIEVPASDIPDAVLRAFHRRDPGKVRRVESIEGGSLFRIEAESGSVFLFDNTGAWRGTVI